jgi:glycosyltransferase involved in cell wall biosynthesis
VVHVSALVLTFTNLFPSAAMPTHGLFVQERMRRVAAAGGFEWQVVAPVPHVAWLLRSGQYRRWAAVPPREQVDGVEVRHPRYRHWPGLSLRRQADAMAAGAEQAVRECVAGRPAVIDAHYLWPDGVAAATLAGRLSLPFVLTARGSDLNVVANDRAVAARIAAAARSAHACFAVSGALCERFAAVTGLPRARIRLARNGVDLERFRPGDRAAERRALGLPGEATLLLGIGRLVAGKGFDLAARALQHLPSRVRLVLVGDGPERATIAALGGDRVLFLGAQPPAVVAQACRACDLLVLPSEREGWPNVVTEALASGLRVVATRVGGIPEILGDPPPADGSLGALVPAGDADALAAAIMRVLAAPADPGRVRAFAQRYGWDEPVALLVATFRAALAGDRAA